MNKPDLTAFQRTVLLSVHVNRPARGSEVREWIEDNTEKTDVADSLLYRSLDDLVNKGLVKRREDPDDARFNVYETTNTGTVTVLVRKNRWQQVNTELQ